MLAEKINCKSTVEVIDLIEKSISMDKGIVPLIGAGMSASSGIPAGLDYFAYLFYCLARVFGTNGNELDLKKKQWDPRTLRWPDFSEMPVYDNFDQKKIKWCSYINNKINRQNRINKNREISDSKKNNEIIDIYFQAIGVVSDWRATLNLLSRLALGDKINKDSRIVIIQQPDERVIDSFFVNLTKGKRPSSSHMLLAHMSDILRIKTILTTNFDSLIENTYQKLINPVAVFDVHLDARLPDADFVRNQRSIVKMHGGRYGLRADFSLDKDPSKDDVKQFVDYLSYYKSKDNRPKLLSQRNLLVMGVSHSSKRVLELMCHAMVKLKDLEIYWICYNNADRVKVLDKFNATFDELNKKGEIEESFYNDYISEKSNDALPQQLFVTSATDLTSFLLELYQSTFLSLPPAGVQFSSVWPFPAKPGATSTNCKYNSFVSEIINEIEKERTQTSLIYIYGKNGISALASDIFYKVTHKYCCIWFNIEHSFSPLDFTYSLIEAISRKVGYFGLIPAQFQISELKSPESKEKRFLIPESLKNQFLRIIRFSKKRIVVFINCREIPTENMNSNTYTENLIILLKDLSNDRAIFILLGHNENIYAKGCKEIHIKEDIVNKLNSHEIISKNKFVGRKEKYNFYRFVLSLALVRNISYLSLLHTWSFIKAPYSLSCGDLKLDNDKIRFKIAKDFLAQLKVFNAFRSDDNHFVYVPYANREKIKESLKKKFNRNYSLIKAESHQGIADWNMKLYRSSGDIHAMAESIYHRLQCFKSSLEISSSPENQQRFLTTSLIEMGQAIKLSENTIYGSFLGLTINKSLIMFIRDLLNEKREVEKLREFSDIKNTAWYCYKLEEIRNNLLEIRQRFLIKTGNIPKKFKELTPSLNHIIREFLHFDERIYTNDLSEMIRDIHKRQYDAAVNKIKNIYNKLGWKNSEITGKLRFNNENKKITEKIREIVRKWICEVIDGNNLKGNDGSGENYELALIYSQDKFKFIIKVFRYHHRLLLLEAQIHRYLYEIKGSSKEGSDYQINNRKLIEAEIIYICSTEMMRYIVDNKFLNHENAILRTNTGIMLSWMQRHHEAYRRYNEAYGYLNFGIQPDSPHEFALVDLRRGETFISKIEQELYKKETDCNKNNTDYDISRGEHDKLTTELKVHFGYLYDAIASIDRGESRMKGYSIDTWWYCWTLELQLNLCNKIISLREKIVKQLNYNQKDKYDLFGHCRECECCGNRFITNLEKGLEIVGNDVLRLARYLDLLIKFSYDTKNPDLSNRFKISKEYGLTLLKNLLGLDEKHGYQTRNMTDSRIHEYAESVYYKYNNKKSN
jgi:hypothetical protein